MNWYPHVPYDKNYPKLFENEKDRIHLVLGNCNIQHFGSTAVSGLSGRGYIDIFVTYPKHRLLEISKVIQKQLNYDYKEHASIPSERLFHKRVVIDSNGEQRIFHLHLTYPQSPDYIQSIKFRDFLRKHPSKAREYENIKKLASQKANKQKTRELAKKVYMDTKRGVIEDILKQIEKAL